MHVRGSCREKSLPRVTKRGRQPLMLHIFSPAAKSVRSICALGTATPLQSHSRPIESDLRLLLSYPLPQLRSTPQRSGQQHQERCLRRSSRLATVRRRPGRSARIPSPELSSRLSCGWPYVTSLLEDDVWRAVKASIDSMPRDTASEQEHRFLNANLRVKRIACASPRRVLAAESGPYQTCRDR